MIDKKTKVAVVMGGPSTEAEISRKTGTAIYQALLSLGYNVVSLELNPKTIMQDLIDQKVEVVFNSLHGLYGEDGRIQSILESMGIPYTGSGVLASAVAMDKSATKRYLSFDKISTPKFLVFNKRFDSVEDVEKKILQEIGIPLVLKAASQGSSIGVEIVKDAENLTNKIAACFEYGDNLVVEQFIEGRELTCAVMEKDGQPYALPIVWIEPHEGFYDFHNKYTKGCTTYHCPAPIGDVLTAKAQDLAKRTYRSLGLSGVARIDLIVDSKDNIYVFEANTVPGMTETSLVPKMAAAAGISFPAICEMILLSAK